MCVWDLEQEAVNVPKRGGGELGAKQDLLQNQENRE